MDEKAEYSGARRPATALLILLASMLMPAAAALAQALEILPLRHRTADQVIPQLKPFVEPGGTLSGMNDKLFLRVSPRNRADLLQLLEALDRPPRRLLISVRQEGDMESEGRSLGASGDLGLGRNARVIVPAGPGVQGSGTVEIRRGDSVIRGTMQETRSVRRENVAQQVQTVEGGRAYINVGQSIALPLTQVVMGPGGAVVSQTVVWQELGTGFDAEPRVAGDTVTLEISPSRVTAGAMPGSANVQRLSTTVSGRLGEWIPLGGSVQESSSERSGVMRQSSRGGVDSRRVYLRVEELP